MILIRYAVGGLPPVIMSSRTKEFDETAQAVSNYLEGLPLTSSQNNELVRLLKLHTLAAEKSGFLDGAQFGVQLGDMLK